MKLLNNAATLHFDAELEIKLTRVGHLRTGIKHICAVFTGRSVRIKERLNFCSDSTQKVAKILSQYEVAP